MAQPKLNHWLYATGGVLVGGFMIRHFGFYHAYSNHRGMKQFFKMWLYFGSGVAVTAVSTILLKLSKISNFFSTCPKIAFFGSIIGMMKVYPRLKYQTSMRKHVKNIVACTGFWFMPSIYYCIFDYISLELALLYCVYILTICFVIGTIIPLKSTFIPDFGLKITISGACWLLTCIISFLIIKPSSAIVNSGIIILLLGILIDDLQHLKFQYGDNDDDDDVVTITFDPLRKSLTVFLESVLIFGRLALLIDIFKEENYDVPTVNSF